MQCYIGLISGTSVDAIDAVLMDFESSPPRELATYTHAIPPGVRCDLLCASREDRLKNALRLDVVMGELLAEAALELLARSGLPATRVCAIGSHGQTISHQPDDDIAFSCQIGDPNVIAERTGLTTVADLRRRDLAAGGQGAPLAPSFHAALFAIPDVHRVVLNIGGIANITKLPARADADVLGFDTGPGNGLMDAWTERHLGKTMDTDAEWAKQGRLLGSLLDALLADPYFDRHPPKSTGKEDFNLRWMERRFARIADCAPASVQRTLCELTAVSIVRAIAAFAPDTREILVCGGGCRNPLLMSRLRESMDATHVCTTAEHGVNPDFVEAAMVAWIAMRTLNRQAGNIPSVTGARHPVILGGIYPGALKGDA